MEKPGYHHHGRGRTDVTRELAVHSPDGLPVIHICKVDAGTDDVFKSRPGTSQDVPDVSQDVPGLCLGRPIVCTNRPGTGDIHRVADTHRS